MKSVVIKRSVLINGCKTSISLEDEFWDALREIAEHGKLGLSKLLEQIDRDRNNINLSSAIRVFVFSHFRALGKKKTTVEPMERPADNRALRARAEEFRILAAGFKDPETRTIMFRVAADYDLLAERFERPESKAGQYADYT
jgi:predicted DNA-binding ribbon-helix-helix protein